MLQDTNNEGGCQGSIPQPIPQLTLEQFIQILHQKKIAV
jgi:hypothetical protein